MSKINKKMYGTLSIHVPEEMLESGAYMYMANDPQLADDEYRVFTETEPNYSSEDLMFYQDASDHMISTGLVVDSKSVPMFLKDEETCLYFRVPKDRESVYLEMHGWAGDYHDYSFWLRVPEKVITGMDEEIEENERILGIVFMSGMHGGSGE